ncbi:MAG: hypothetical protein U0Y68_23950 [Blastocatellia bacterium]
MFNYLSINHKTIRAVANEEFLSLEHRRAWIIFSCYCAGENGCLDTLKAVSKAAMLSPDSAEQFYEEIVELCEVRGELIAPKEVWRALDRAAERSNENSRKGKLGGRPKKPQLSEENLRLSNGKPQLQKQKPSEGEGESEVNGESEEKGTRAGARNAPLFSLVSWLGDAQDFFDRLYGGLAGADTERLCGQIKLIADKRIRGHPVALADVKQFTQEQSLPAVRFLAENFSRWVANQNRENVNGKSQPEPARLSAAQRKQADYAAYFTSNDGPEDNQSA